MKRLVVFFATASLCQSCASPVIETTTDRNAKSDAPMIGYYLPKAEIPVTVTLDGKKQSLVLTYSATPKIVLDTKNKYFIRFNHEPLSSDQFTVSAPEGLLEKVSTTTSDNTVAAIEGVNTIISKSKDLKTESNSPEFMAAGAEKIKKCAGSKSSMKIDFSQKTQSNKKSVEKTEECDIEIHATIEADKTGNLFSSSDIPTSDMNRKCKNCLFFRVNQLYKITITASFPKEKSSDQAVIEDSFTVMAPDMDTIAYAQFKRHPFVESSQTLEFNKGVLKGISVNRPSEVVGFLKVPAAGLATAIAIKSLD
ncbi:hypothetical protein [Agrobacterium vitis]|uniref:hypothetical protein n=1 Tax=Agrobacterium vitis TaxID=373 RepID=UPI00157344E3|nr:hypothetical protein [Agrobacterium vitis]NSZ53000.1 hypothetical protein [Agrobacterium vitis]NTA31759.1 hypothetical protein [Agrobacterium vitis]